MFWTIIALSMTVLMGGIIAYNGDVIGRKFGKKRLSMFGLRPKHTAILITSVTGVLISASTTAAIFLLTPPVRRVMLEGEKAIRDNTKFQRQNVKLSRENVDLTGQRALLQSEVVSERLKVLGLRRKSAAAEKELKMVQAFLASSQRRLRVAEELQRKAESKTAELERKLEPLKKLAKDLAQGNVKLAEDNSRLTTLNRQLTARMEELSKEVAKKAEQNRQYDIANAEVARQNESLVRENRTLITRNDELARQRQQLEGVNKELFLKNTSMERINAALSEGASEAEQKLARLRAETQQLEQVLRLSVGAFYSTLEALRTRPIAVHTGEDLARITVPARSTAAQVRDYLRQLTREASDSARSKGSDPGERATTLAVQIVDKRTLADTPFGVREVSITEEQQVNQVVSIVSESTVPVCVLAVAAGNSVKGEPAIIDLQPIADRLVYPRGRMVATKKLNANQPPETVFMDMVKFLKEVGRMAVERGMIPRLDPSTGEPQVGALDWPELVRLVERVRGYSRTVQVSAVAADDTSASGPLRLEFKVEGTL